MKSFPLSQSTYLAYELFRESAAAAQDSATIALGVLDGKRVILGLIVQIRGGVIRNATTFDYLHLNAPLTMSAESFERLWHAFAHPLPAAALLCDRATFEGLGRTDHKLGYLAAVGHAQPYFYRVELD